ncbi:MAG: cell wall metabolism sensor histidine kinase WalK [Saprospiraceae bacterium]|nr:cell wall metabolism sensor histidine kinase WalK [Saprospiraceae bacterium]
MQLSLQNEHYQDVQMVVKFVDGLKNIFVVIKNLFGWFAVRVAAFFVMLPVNLILEYLVYRLRKPKLVRLEDISSNEYRQLRLRHDEIGQLLISFNQIADRLEEEKKKTTFVFRWTINIILKARHLLVEQYNQNAAAFASLAPKKPSYKGFERLTEEELWNDRAKSYEYLI